MQKIWRCKMATYIVKPNQNLFDVALRLYGSIEGLFDILISNPELNMNSQLTYGQKIEYHESFILNKPIVDEFQKQNIVPSGGDKGVYFKHTEEDLIAIVRVNEDMTYSNFKVAGEGTVIVDWCDNSDLQYINLTADLQTIEHYFNCEVDERRIKIYGNSNTLKLTQLNSTGLGGAIIMCRPLVVDEYVCIGREFSLTGLYLFRGTYKVDLSGSNIASLLPIGDMDLQELDLTDVFYVDGNVLDDYLEYVVNHYESRRPCTVRLSSEPSERGYKAINTILSEPEWNVSDNWKFYINDNLYQLDNDTNAK